MPVDDEIPGDILLGDGGYGDSHQFRETVRILGFDYALGIHATTTMWRLDSRERRRGEAASARDITRELGPKAFRRVTWREGTAEGKRGKMSSRFAFCRVKIANDDGIDPGKHEPIWLIAEWPEGEKAPTKFALTTLKRTMSKKEIVRIFKERYRTEFYRPMLADWQNQGSWEEQGSLTAADRAYQKWNDTLKNYEQPPLDPAIAEEIEAYVNRRHKEILPNG